MSKTSEKVEVFLAENGLRLDGVYHTGYAYNA
jgi:hypothetical protein